jgi:cytoskeletal protein CcmA (bactofilin family)
MVIFIVVVIALLLSSFILFIHVHKQFRLRTDHVIETVALANQGIQFALLNEMVNGDTLSVDLNAFEYKSLNVQKSYWGIFEKAYSKATIKSITLEKLALIGSEGNTNRPALYLKDNNKPLVLVGHTKIEGKAYLPERGTRSGNISGHSYYGNEFIYGSIEQSKAFPQLDKGLLAHIKTLNNSTLGFKNLEHIELNTSKKFTNSFKAPLQFAYSDSDLFLGDISVSGHIIIQSKTRIVIERDAKLNDVILVAPIIEIKSYVNGVFQAIATKQIKVSDHVTLGYPSALVLYKDYEKSNNKDMGTNLSVGNQSHIKGNIIALGKTLSTNYDAQITISPNAIVTGEIYCEQNLELRGTVYGSVYTDNFIIKESGSIYQNHLFNAKINSK